LKAGSRYELDRSSLAYPRPCRVSQRRGRGAAAVVTIGIKRIARELGIARDTVRKVLRSGATGFSYKREVQPQRKLGSWVETLTAILESEDKLPRRERRSTIRLFEELRGRGYNGAHDSVHRFVKAWRADRARTPAQAFIPLRFDPGEAYQFDSHGGVRVKTDSNPSYVCSVSMV
jgi:transposase